MGNIEKANKYFSKNIDDNIWIIEEVNEPMTDHNIDEIDLSISCYLVNDEKLIEKSI